MYGIPYLYVYIFCEIILHAHARTLPYEIIIYTGERCTTNVYILRCSWQLHLCSTREPIIFVQFSHRTLYHHTRGGDSVRCINRTHVTHMWHARGMHHLIQWIMATLSLHDIQNAIQSQLGSNTCIYLVNIIYFVEHAKED